MIGVHFFQLNRFCVNSGNTLFGEPKLFGGSLTYIADSVAGVGVMLAGLRGRVQGSTDDLEGKRADVMHEVRQRGPLSLWLERWFLYRRRIGSGIL